MAESRWCSEYELVKRGLSYECQAAARASGKLRSKQVGSTHTYRAQDVDDFLLGEARSENQRRAAQASASAPATTAPSTARPMRFESLSAAQFAARCGNPAAISMSLDEARATSELLDVALSLTPDNRPQSSQDPVRTWDSLVASLVAEGKSKREAISVLAKNEPQLHREYLREYTRRERAR